MGAAGWGTGAAGAAATLEAAAAALEVVGRWLSILFPSPLLLLLGIILSPIIHPHIFLPLPLLPLCNLILSPLPSTLVAGVRGAGNVILLNLFRNLISQKLSQRSIVSHLCRHFLEGTDFGLQPLDIGSRYLGIVCEVLINRSLACGITQPQAAPSSRGTPSTPAASTVAWLLLKALPKQQLQYRTSHRSS